MEAVTQKHSGPHGGQPDCRKQQCGLFEELRNKLVGNRWVLNLCAKNSALDSKDLNSCHILSYYLTCMISLLHCVLLFQILLLIFKDDVAWQVLSFIVSTWVSNSWESVGNSSHVSMASKQWR